MLSGWLKFAGVVLLFVAVGAVLSISLVLAGCLGGIIGLALLGLDWYQQKTRIYTQTLLATKPFNLKLPADIGQATLTAVALQGDNTYSQKVEFTHKFAQNFEELRGYAEVMDGSMFEVQCALVAEPANQNLAHAVAVTCGGLVLGYISSFESESLYAFLMQHRSMARVNSNINFRCLSQTSTLELDLTRPFRIVVGV